MKWYRDADDWLHEIKEQNGTFSWINHLIVLYEKTPFGFCQYYDCFDANSIENWYDVTERGDTYSIDYLIGDEAFLGKGFGKKIVKLLTDIVRTKENGKKIIVQPDKENLPSNNVLLANGYSYDKEHEFYIKYLV